MDYFSYNNSSWQEYDIGQLKKMIDYYDANLKAATDLKIQKPYTFLLRDSVIAYIYLAQFVNSPLSKEYHIGRARASLDQWKRLYQDTDPDSLFYCGIFKFMEALSRKNPEYAMSDFRSAKDLFEQCRSAYRDRPSRKFNFPMYLIGENTNSLSGLIVFDDKGKDRNLGVFEGALEKLHDEKNSYYIMYKGHKILCDKKNAYSEEDNIRSAEIGQKIVFSFHIGIKRSGLFAYKYRKVA